MYLNYLRKYTWHKIHLHTFPISEKNKTQNPVPIISIKGLPERAEEGFWHENGQKDNF